MLLRFLPKRTPSLQRFVGIRFMSRSSESIFGDSCPLVVTPRQVLDAPAGSVTVLDASWHMPNSPRKGKDEFYKTRIPHARFLDLDEVASPNELGLKHMMPSGEKFATSCGMCMFYKYYWDHIAVNGRCWGGCLPSFAELLGITPQSHVVMYEHHYSYAFAMTDVCYTNTTVMTLMVSSLHPEPCSCFVPSDTNVPASSMAVYRTGVHTAAPSRQAT